MESKGPSIEELIDLLTGVDYLASNEASQHLIKLGSESLPALAKALQQVSIESQKPPIYFTLMKIKTAETAAILLSQFHKESNNSFRAIIAEGLGLAKCQEAGPILEQALNNIQDKELDWSIRVALAHLG